MECLQEVVPRFYEVDVEGTRYRRNRKDLIATQESPEINNHAGESDESCLTDDQSQRVIDPVQPGMPSPEDTAQNDQRPLKELQKLLSQLKEDPPEGA